MDARIWQRLIPVLQQARVVGLHGGGEPFCYPHLFPLLDYIDTGRTEVGFYTNGLLLTAINARRLIEHKVAWIGISMDAASPEVYLRIRRSSVWERLLGNIRHLVQLKAEMGSQRPIIEINMTLMRGNLSDAPRFVELGAELGVNRVMFQQLFPTDSNWATEAPDGYRFEYKAEQVGNCIALHDEMMELAWARSQTLGIPLIYEMAYDGTGTQKPQGYQQCGPAERPAEPSLPAAPEVPCLFPWQSLWVGVDGDVFFCCFHQQNDGLPMGNILRQDLETIWNGTRARIIRDLVLHERVPRCCVGCFMVSGRAQ
jgi:MoaA/NifB/PqqE/SkfB family radical SAM enzyme